MRRSKVHSMDDLWKLTQHIHHLGWQVNEHPKRKKLGESITSLYEAGLTIQQIEDLTTVIIDAYDLGKLDSTT